MFPSSGYFRGVPCPFYASGLCERPYCHFRHSRSEAERSAKTAKTEVGPSYSTSNTPSYQNGVGGILKTVAVSHVKDTALEHSSSLVPEGLVEAYETSSSLQNDTTEIANNVQSDLNDSLSIPSFSSTDPILPESEHEPPVSVKSLPQISGLPKARKSLPSYVPTPKAFDNLDAKDGVPSYTPTPKSVSDELAKKSGRVIEYDPINNFAVTDNHKSSDEEEAAFSSEEDNEAIKFANGDTISKKTGLNLEDNEAQLIKNGNCRPAAAAEDDLTDSDEDVSLQASVETSNNVQKMATSFSDLLTPSSFFTEKHTKISSTSSGGSKIKYHDFPKASIPGGKDSTRHTKRGAASEKSHNSRDLQRSNSTKSVSSSHSKSNSSSTHKSSSSTSSSKEKERSHKKKSFSSSHTSSQSHKSSSASSLSHTDSNKSSNHYSSPPSTSSLTNSKGNKSYSSTPKDSNHHSKSLSSTSKKPKEKSPMSSTLTVSSKPHSSSSEKENKHSSSSQYSSHKSHSVSRSLSSSSSPSTLSKHGKSKHSRAECSKSLDRKIRSVSSDSSIHDKKPAVIKNVEDKKPSLAAKDSSKPERKQHSLETSDTTNVKFEKKLKDAKASSVKISLSKSKSSKSGIKKESSARSNKQPSQDKKASIVSKSGDAFDSDIEIIEPPPPPVYNISDSDDNDVHDTNTEVQKEGGMKTLDDDSDTELSFQDEIDLMSDSDTFDECLRIFQESERQMAEKLKRGRDNICPDKRKAQEELESFESSENLLISVGKKRMAHTTSQKISRNHKPLVPAKPRLSPAQVMHNRIVEMQKRALLRAARREGRESELPSMLGGKEISVTTGITVMGGGLPAASPLSRCNGSSSSNGPDSTTSAATFGLSPSLLPSTGQRKRQAHAPSKTLFAGHKTPPHKSASASNTGDRENGKPGPSSMSPNTFYTKKTPSSSVVPRTVTAAGTASKTEKRKAHEPTVSNLKRPLIPADFGSKVPTNVRQRYLNLIIDEHLKFRPELEAFTKGEEDEKAVYERANNKNIYLGVAVNTIKRIRNEAAQLLPSSSKKLKLDSSSGRLGGHATQSHAATLGGPSAARQSYTLNRSKPSTVSVPVKIEGKEFYNRLKTYILTEDQLKENGFPRPGDNGSSKVQFFKEEDTSESLKENERLCRRCGTRFNVTKDGEPISNGLCVYHYGNAFKKRVSGAIESRYGCCDEKAGTVGCQVASCHVHERNKVDNRSGYMKTMPASTTSEKNCKVYALDCEMVYTKAGLELARLTVVGEDCEVVYESLVQPDTDIIDFNTRFSGITAADMNGVTTDIRGVQAVMLSMISDKTILMGHSLESDLIALKLIHSTVVDTSLVFPHRLGLPYKRALRNLMLDHLQKIIQSSDGGHDSKEDAVACMQLMMYKVKEDVRKESRRF